MGEVPQLSQFTPIWGNDKFTPGRHDAGLKFGLSKMRDLCNNETMLSFQELRQKFDLPKTRFFLNIFKLGILLIRQHNFPLLPDLSPLEKNTLNLFNGGRQISIFID